MITREKQKFNLGDKVFCFDMLTEGAPMTEGVVCKVEITGAGNVQYGMKTHVGEMVGREQTIATTLEACQEQQAEFLAMRVKQVEVASEYFGAPLFDIKELTADFPASALTPKEGADNGE